MRLLSALLILFLFLSFAPKQTLAQINESTSSAIVKYDLAYPGILPDSPLYKLKVIRDKITEFLIFDPKNKAEFYLLQTDKGILASSILVEKNKIDLAIETALKAENNYTMLVLEVKKMRSKPDEKFVTKAKTAALKHQEIINLLIQRSLSLESKDLFGKVLYFSQSNLETLGNYINKHRFKN